MLLAAGLLSAGLPVAAAWFVVDTRLPDTTASAAIDPILPCTAITNEGGASLTRPP